MGMMGKNKKTAKEMQRREGQLLTYWQKQGWRSQTPGGEEEALDSGRW